MAGVRILLVMLKGHCREHVDCYYCMLGVASAIKLSSYQLPNLGLSEQSQSPLRIGVLRVF